MTLARLCKWFVLVTSFPCKKYSSFGEEHKQRKKCSLLLLRGYSQEENWQLKLTAKVGIVNYVRSQPSLSPRQSVTYVIAVYFHNFLSIWEVDLLRSHEQRTPGNGFTQIHISQIYWPTWQMQIKFGIFSVAMIFSAHFVNLGPLFVFLIQRFFMLDNNKCQWIHLSTLR